MSSKSQTTTRIGVIYPEDGASPVKTRVKELRKFLPSGVRIRLRPHPVPNENNTAELAEQLAVSEEIETAARQFVSFQPHVIAYDCMTISFIFGFGTDEDISKRIQSATGTLAITASTAVLRALKSLKVKRLAVATPYLPDVDERLTKFLEGNRISVVSLRSLGLLRYHSCVDADTIQKVAISADVPEADGLFIGCAGQKTAGFVAGLERQLGKPVITANQATIWAALRIARVSELRPDVGALMAHPWES